MQNVRFRKDIQGLRAIAVLSVIIFHFNHEVLSGGFVGVDIFLVISGYLITSIILNKKQQNNFSLKRFYLNRFNRIVPAYATMLAIVSICMSLLLVPDDFNYFKQSLFSSLYFASNVYFSNFGSYFAPNANEMPLLHTWSLAIEMQFYLLFPFFILAIPNNHTRKAIILIILLLLLYTGYQINIAGKDGYFSLAARIPEFLIGSLIATESKKKRLQNFIKRNKEVLSLLSLILIVLSLSLINSNLNFPGFLALPACIGTAIIISLKDSYINKLLSCRPLVLIGSISYSLYLWHWPTLSAIRYYTENYELNLAFATLFTLLTTLLALSSYYLIERKTLYSPNLKRQNFRPALIVTISVIFLPISTNINEYIIDSLPQSRKQYAPPNTICHGRLIGDCIRGDINSNNEILIIGDSHAAQLNLFADAVGKENHQKFKVITASSCVTVPNFDYDRLPTWAQAPCQKQIEEVEKLLPNYKTILVAGMWSYQSKSEKFMQAFDDFLSSTNASNQKVVVLAQTPLLESNILRQQRFGALGLPQSIETKKDWDQGNKLIEAHIHNYKNAFFLDLSSLNLFSEAPYFMQELIYRDNSHLNEYGSRLYGKAASPYLKSI